jgi:subtilisin family serine protease
MDNTRKALSAGAAVLLLAAALGGSSPAVASSPAASRPATAASASVVTLITGDRVRLVPEPAGQVAVGIEPAPGRENVGFVRQSSAGAHGTDISVVPADAVSLLAAGRLDPRLFDVTDLARQGLTDAASPALPLIVTSSPGTAATAARPAAPAGTQMVGNLPSIGGSVVREDRRRGSAFWSWLTTTSGFGHVFLDGIAHPLSDPGTTQIGAPAAWHAGLTGAGVTVGILDSGVDANHPDLAGKVVEARDFTGTRPDAGDDIGHGTHVAGIIAGTGAASNGMFRGVAPDAKLISGKVCAILGVVIGCPDSAVIAGMEWIAPKVRVVNVSLGGASTDGTDPMSLAVDHLTAQFGTLFVAAAGDANDPVASITAPAAADAALAVGSVDSQDQTSSFSTRGPRLGDRAMKPDIAAPGEGIVSARAAGTPDGDLDPVDANYAILSGTSIATPHVSGAAAILVQQHPDWSGAQIRSALMSTAKPTAGVFDQGAGRVDVARAVTQPVTATGGSLSYGFFRWPHRDQARRTVTYRNDGDLPVTLTIGVTATGPNGQAAPAGLFTASAPQVSVPAHGTASVDVIANPAVGAGLFGGRVTAAGGNVTVQTAFDAFVEPESHDLTVRLIGRTGQVHSVIGQAIDTATGQAFGLRPFSADGTVVVRLPKGKFDIDALDIRADPAAPNQPTAITVLSKPDVTLGADVTVTLDATEGRPVSAVVDRPDTALQFGEVGVLSTNPAGDRGSSVSWIAGAGQRLFAVPTSHRVTDHQLDFFFRVTLARVAPGTNPSAFVYQLAFLERGLIPADTVYRVRNSDLATVDARYFAQGAPSSSVRADFANLPIPGFGPSNFQIFGHTLPSRRTEYYTASPDVTWLHLLAITDPAVTDAENVASFLRTYRPGRSQSNWNRAPLGPAFGAVSDGFGVLRAGDQLSVAATLLSGNDPHQYTFAPIGLTGTTTLSRDGTTLGTSPTPGMGAFPIPASSGTYTLRATGTRAVPFSVIGTAVDVTWTFHEPGAAAAVTPLPLLVVRASGDVDGQGTAPADSPFQLSLLAQGQPGGPAFRLAALRVETSYDDGTTWAADPTTFNGDEGHALLHHPAGAGFASLRITAQDTAGDSVTQTVIRAYQIAPRS